MAESPARERALPPILPRPRQIQTDSGAFSLREGLPIALGPGADDRDFETARALQRGVRERVGVTLPIEGHLDPHDLEGAISLRIDELFGAELAPELLPQAYRLEITREGVRILAGGAPGLRYAAETLLQLVGANGRIPACPAARSPPRRASKPWWSYAPDSS